MRIRTATRRMSGVTCTSAKFTGEGAGAVRWRRPVAPSGGAVVADYSEGGAVVAAVVGDQVRVVGSGAGQAAPRAGLGERDVDGLRPVVDVGDGQRGLPVALALRGLVAVRGDGP